MTMTLLPSAPQRSDPPATFISKADAFVAALPTFVTEANALEVAVDADRVEAAASAAAALVSEGNADTSEANALASANASAASALTAINAPGTSATSTTSDTVEVGSTAITIQTGKAFVVGMFVVMASTASPSNYLVGQITSYNSGTGQLDINATSVGGAGTFDAWTISLTAAGGGSSGSFTISNLLALV